MVHTAYVFAVFEHIWSGRDVLSSFCPKLQNHPQHMQFNSNYHHLLFYGEKMVAKVDFDNTWSHHDLDL